MKKGYLSVPSADAEKQPWFDEKHYYYPTTPLISVEESTPQLSWLTKLNQGFMSARQKEKSTRKSMILRSRTRGIKLLFTLIFCAVSMYFVHRFVNNYIGFALPSETAIDLFKSIPSSDHLKRYFTDYATRSQNLAEWTRDTWIEFGIKDTKIEEYWPILNTPNNTRLAIIDGSKENVLFELSSSDASSNNSIPFHAYSSNGNVTGPVVYVNYGRLTDFQFLLARGVSFKGTIALMRHGVIKKGYKVKMAHEFGCIGALLYSDYEDDVSSATTNEIVEQGNVLYGVGDPFTPGYASKNSSTPPQQEAEGMPKIPSLPISGKDALELLKATEGFGIQGSITWFGGFCDVNYFSGPSEALVNLVNINNYEAEPVHNVIAKIAGSIEPNRAIIIGNHRDAWSSGLIDPASGSAVLMELVRAIGVLLERGWRPRRTLIIASWDAKRFGAVGSNEWVEYYQSWLTEEAVAYLNVDYAVSGSHFTAQSSPLLNQLLYQVTQEVIDPRTSKSVFDVWNTDKNASSTAADDFLVSSAIPLPLTDALSTESDTTAFFNHMGVSSISFGFRGASHPSILIVEWMEKHGDPTFEYHQVLTRIWGLLVLRLTSDTILPMYPQDYTNEIVRHMDHLSMQQGCISFPFISSALHSLSATAIQFDKQKKNWMHQLKVRKHYSKRLQSHVARTNERLLQFERAFIDLERGHVIYGPNSNTGMVIALPGLSEAVENDTHVNAKYMEERISKLLLNAERTLRGHFDDYDEGDDEDEEEENENMD